MYPLTGKCGILYVSTRTFVLLFFVLQGVLFVRQRIEVEDLPEDTIVMTDEYIFVGIGGKEESTRGETS